MRGRCATLTLVALLTTPVAAHVVETPSCEGTATLDTRTVENPSGGAGADVAAWDVTVPACAKLLVYEIVDADTGRLVPRDAVFPHTSRMERWERREGRMRLHLFLQNSDVAASCGRGCTRKAERWVRRVRAVVRWSSDTRGA